MASYKGEPVFAWIPIKTQSGRWVWLTWAWRDVVTYADGEQSVRFYANRK